MKRMFTLSIHAASTLTDTSDASSLERIWGEPRSVAHSKEHADMQTNTTRYGPAWSETPTQSTTVDTARPPACHYAHRTAPHHTTPLEAHTGLDVTNTSRHMHYRLTTHP